MTGIRFIACISIVILTAGAVRAETADYSWIKPRAHQSVLVSIAAAAGRWIVVGERGHVLVSDDARNWRQVLVPTRVLLTAVTLDERGVGIAVGHDATIIRTSDNGETWHRVYHDQEEQSPLLDVIMVDNDRVVAVGAYGLYVESQDGGQTWEQGFLEPEALDAASPDEAGEDELYYDYHLNDIAIAGDGRWYVAAEAGNIFRSDDHGATWVRLPSPYPGSFFGVLPMDEAGVMLFGLQGRLFRSGDGGVTWTRVQTGTDATLSSGLRLGNGRALITGYAGVLLTDVGGEGEPVSVSLSGRPAISDARLLNDGDLLTVGDEGVHRWPAGMLWDR
jgi:photosystem II stability/assembly factor-like uncharacterized protein